MDITQLSQLIMLIFAVSLASERLIALLKTLIPWLAGPSQPAEATNIPNDKWRQLTVMLIAFLSSWLTASFLNGNFNPFATIAFQVGQQTIKLYAVFIGFLASGGSAFWSGLLGYTNAVKDLKKNQLVGEKLALRTLLFNGEQNPPGQLEAARLTPRNSATNVEPDVSRLILKVSKSTADFRELDLFTPLSDLGFNSAMCSDLASQLTNYVSSIRPGVAVDNAEIKLASTGQNISDLIKQKIAG